MAADRQHTIKVIKVLLLPDEYLNTLTRTFIFYFINDILVNYNKENAIINNSGRKLSTLVAMRERESTMALGKYGYYCLEFIY